MSGMLRERKKRLHIIIPESLDDDMRNFIVATGTTYEYGSISRLVTEALRLYLDPGQQSTHTQKAILHKYSNQKYDVLMSQIKAYLEPKYQYAIFDNIPEKHINEAISVIVDIRDNRSIKAWRQKLEMGRYIERAAVGAKVFKILKDIEIER